MSIDDIKARNYNLDIKNPNTEDPTHGDPVLMLAKYQHTLAEIAALRASLQAELASAMGE